MRILDSVRLIWRYQVRPHSVLVAVPPCASFLLFVTLGGSAKLTGVLVAISTFAVFVLYPEFALAAYVVVGDLKGDDRIAALFPCDLTVAISTIVLAGILLNLIRGKRVAPLPPVYFLFLVLAAMMSASLLYTPVFSAGFDKLEQFLTVTAIAGPFFVLPDEDAMKRFLWCLGGAAYVICAMALAGLGGTDRLVTPSDNTIGLGRLACVLTAMIWFAAVPRARLAKRLLAYVAIIVPLVATIGSGSRGSFVALTLVILASLLLDKRLILDVVALASLAFAAVPFVKIPQASFEYLGSLADPQSSRSLLDFRADLLDYGWKLLRQHPLIGAGIGGFRYSSPNPGLYKWPHDLLLELACELGIPAAIVGLAIFGCAIRESIEQLREPASAFFTLSTIAAALLCIGLLAAITTGNINSDRSIWLFVSLVFVIRGYRLKSRERLPAPIEQTSQEPRLAHA
jgi:O-antigen ligase